MPEMVGPVEHPLLEEPQGSDLQDLLIIVGVVALVVLAILLVIFVLGGVERMMRIRD